MRFVNETFITLLKKTPNGRKHCLLIFKHLMILIKYRTLQKSLKYYHNISEISYQIISEITLNALCLHKITEKATLKIRMNVV